MRPTLVKKSENKGVTGVKVSLRKKKINKTLLLGLKQIQTTKLYGQPCVLLFSKLCCFSLCMLRVFKSFFN